MKKIVLFTLFVAVMSISGCSSGSNDTGILVDNTTDATTYTNTIESIIDSNCLNCHTNPPTNGAPMSLTTYDDVKNAVQSRGLISRIELSVGTTGVMPPSGSTLSTANIQAIKDWQLDGFPQ